MTALPQPDDLTSLVLRTDFSDDSAWHAFTALLDGSDEHRHATCVSDPGYAGVTIQALVDADAAAHDDDKVMYLFLADATTMAGSERSLLAVDLHDDPGRTFRLPPRWFGEVSANLTIGNLDFAEFAEATDESGTYRGLDGE